MSSRQNAHLNYFLLICSLHCLFAVQLLQGSYMLVGDQTLLLSIASIHSVSHGGSSATLSHRDEAFLYS